MSVYKWIVNRETDSFRIDDEYGRTLYDARRTPYDPPRYIENSIIVDEYTTDGVTVLVI